MNLPPPPPPRPDLMTADAGEAWRIANPGHMNAPAVVGAGFRLWSERWVPWGLVTFLFFGVLSIVLAAADPTSAPYQRDGLLDDPEVMRLTPSVVVLNLLITLLLGPWLYLILTRATLRATFEPDRGGLIGRTIRGVPSLLWILLILLAAAFAAIVPFIAVAAATIDPSSSEAGLTALAIAFIGLLALVFFWLGPRLILVIHTFVAEDRRGTKAIAEAWRRTRGAWWMVLGVIVLNLLIGFAISLVPSSIAATAFPEGTIAHAVPRAMILSLVNALVTPIGVAISSVLYLELSARKGVLSQAKLAGMLSRFDGR